MTGLVYFVQAGTDGPIKIGYTRSAAVTRRIGEIQVGSAAKIDLLGCMPGDRAKEAEIHARFASARIRGEWFHPTAELLNAISEMRVPLPETESEQAFSDEPNPVKRWLKKNRRTQSWLAAKLGVTQGRISILIARGTNSLRVGLALRDATEGDVTLDQIVDLWEAA